MADKRRTKGEDRGGYEPVGGPAAPGQDEAADRPLYAPVPGNPGATAEGSADVRSTAAGMGGPGLWEGFQLTPAQVRAVEADKRRVKAIQDGNARAASMSPEDWVRFCVQEACDKANDGQPCYARATLETELRKRLEALGD